MEAHADPEIFRLRLGKALDFEFHEDYIGSLFSIRGPRETTALLDIERAFNKLEKVALVRRKKTGKPLVMIINGMHMVHDDDVGKDLLELLQQRAEGWAAAGLVTMVFNSDDYWYDINPKRPPVALVELGARLYRGQDLNVYLPFCMGNNSPRSTVVLQAVFDCGWHELKCTTGSMNG